MSKAKAMKCEKSVFEKRANEIDILIYRAERLISLKSSGVKVKPLLDATVDALNDYANDFDA